MSEKQFNCDLYANEIKRLDKRVSDLEKHRESDKNQVHELDKSLSVFISEIKNITEELKTVANNAKEAVTRSATAHDKEISMLKEKVIATEKKVEKLNDKLEQETIGADAEKWKKVTSYIMTGIVGAVLAYILSQIGL